jgi:GMP synthase-like glutamine amidotransferase
MNWQSAQRTAPIRLAILDMYDGVPNQGMRCIKEIVSRFDKEVSCEVFDVRGKAQTPDMSYDIFISTGGPGSPHDGDGHWDKRYYEWLDRAWKWNQKDRPDKKYVFFICHSFQMACKFFEVAEVNERRSQSFGTFPCHLTEAGYEDPGFRGLPSPFWVADFRHWQVVQPKQERLERLGAKILALEKIRPHVPLERAVMAIRFSEEFFGAQFHPEADPEGMLEHFIEPQRRKSIIEEHSEEKYLRMIRDLNDSGKLQLTQDIVIPLFLHRSIQQIRRQRQVGV